MKENIYIFNNKIPDNIVKKAIKNQKKLIKKYNYKKDEKYDYKAQKNPILFPLFNMYNITTDKNGEEIKTENSILISSIRMGYGHYRASLALISAAYSKGLTPYFLDMLSIDSPAAKIINHLNYLYSLGSRLSQKIPIFNKFYWEPLTAETMKKISYNAIDRKMCELFSNLFYTIPKNIPILTTHSWPAQAAVFAGHQKVINVVLDNLPLALHYAEGALHTVQSTSAYIGYRTLRNMEITDEKINIISDSVFKIAGHYVDHEIVSNIENDCNNRINRLKNKSPKRLLISIGGAGAQKELVLNLIKYSIPFVKEKKISLLINFGDHLSFLDYLKNNLPELENISKVYNEWNNILDFANSYKDNYLEGIHLFHNNDIYVAVYTTNLLMRICDLLITKPGELTYYPVPKLFIPRVGGHEAWNAIRSSEIGDGTIECENFSQITRVLDMIINEDELIKILCDNIIKLNKIGIYNGAYNVMDLAMKF